MQSLHDFQYDAAENQEGLQDLANAAGSYAQLDAYFLDDRMDDDHTHAPIEAVLHQAHMRTAVPSNALGMRFDARMLTPPPPSTARLPTSPPPPPLINVDTQPEPTTKATQLEGFANILRFIQKFITEHTKKNLRRIHISSELEQQIWDDAKIGTYLAIPAIDARELKRRRL